MEKRTEIRVVKRPGRKKKFENLNVITLNTRGSHVNTIFQGEVMNFLNTNRNKAFSLKELVVLYIKIEGDRYTPKFISVDQNAIITGDITKISYHVQNNTIEWKYILSKRVKTRFRNVFGQLIMNGMLSFQPRII